MPSQRRPVKKKKKQTKRRAARRTSIHTQSSYEGQYGLHGRACAEEKQSRRGPAG
jgi:hypothetical protein